MPEHLHLSGAFTNPLNKSVNRRSTSSPAPMFIMDREGRLLDSQGSFIDEPQTEPPPSNPSANPPMHPVKRLPDNFIDRTTRKRFAETVVRTSKTTSFSHVENEIAWRYTIYPVFSADGTIGHFLLTVRVISTETVAERKIHNNLGAITDLYDAIPASIIIVDADMRLAGWNRFSRDTINGLSDLEMQGINPLKRVHPDDFAEISRKVHDIIHFDVEESAEFRMFHKKGPPYKWAMFRGKRAIIENKPCMVAVVTEITELKEAEEKQKKLQEQLLQYQKMELVGQLAGGIAHDFNNALAAIIGNTELVLGKLDPSNPVVSNISDIHTLALRSAAMTRQLLAFARKQVVMPIVFNLNEAVSECIHLHQRLFDENIHLEWFPCNQPLMVKIDPAQLNQILSNLLINARDAISNGGQIRIDCRHVHFDQADCNNEHSGMSPGDYARLSVSDTGSGIDVAILPHIYEPFFTTKEVGKGTGLGLSTVYGIVMQNNGHIECHSEPGKGTTFDVWLPSHLECSAKEEESAEEGQLAMHRTETIMLVEDEPYILKLIRDILESHGFTVLTTRDAEECLQTADEQEHRIDLVVSDVVLPSMNGIEMSRLLQERNPDLKLLFMSAHAPEHVSRQKKLREGVDFIQKPFGIDDFIRAIDRVLNTHETQL
ncbi:MAG: response regulator [Chlorobiaceae bacterium]|nr:response regulator [Chlorobiaceae bacterium]